MADLTTASVLSFERKLDVSDGVLSQKNANNDLPEKPVVVREKSVRGTISNRQKAAITKDRAKLDAKIQKPNLQKVDVATLDNGYDTVVCTWTCKVMPFDGSPSVCNNTDYQTRVLEVVQGYIDEHGMGELAGRYAANIANARWLWRNRMGAQQVTVSVTLDDNQEVRFEDAQQVRLNDLPPASAQLTALGDEIGNGLVNSERPRVLTVRAEAFIGDGQEVYPSQELLLDSGDKKSKVLYQFDDTTRQAGIHSQKIGNAIRTIDTWYDGEPKFPIAVEPFGSVTTLGKAFRQPKDKIDFYTLFDDWVLKGEKPAVEQQHYVIAVLLRGGVFGESSKEKT